MAMRVMINALSVKEGGTLVVLDRLLRAMMVQDPGVEWLVVANPRVAHLLPYDSKIRLLVFDWAERSAVHLQYWYQSTLPVLVRRLRPDVLFSQTNYLPYFRVPCPTLLLVQHAGHFTPAYQRMMLATLKGWPSRMIWHAKTRWVWRSVHQATMVTVQTKALADAISAQEGIPNERIRVIPHGPGVVTLATRPRYSPGGRTWRIGYIATPGVQKNFGVLFEAVRLLRQTKRAVTLVLTLDNNDPLYNPILAQMQVCNILTWVEDHGVIAQDRIYELYNSLDLFVFPSLCESFGFPLVEAMGSGIPVMVADIASHREIAGDAGTIFDPADATILAARIAALMDDPAEYERLSARSLNRSRKYSWDHAGRETLEALFAVRR